LICFPLLGKYVTAVGVVLHLQVRSSVYSILGNVPDRSFVYWWGHAQYNRWRADQLF